MRTCTHCKRKRPNRWLDFYGSFCKDCYNTVLPKYAVNDEIFFIDNEHIKGTKNFKAVISPGKIVGVHKLNKPREDLLYNYTILDRNERIRYRYDRDISFKEQDLISRAKQANLVRESMREMRRQLREITQDIVS